MNVRTLARTALMGLATLAALATASAQTSVLLISDTGENASFGGVHRIDLKTGKDLGLINPLHLHHPSALAVMPHERVVAIADDWGLALYDAITGEYYETCCTNDYLGGKIVSMRFGADRNLYAVIRTDSVHYKVTRFYSWTGYRYASSTETLAWLGNTVSIGFSAYGTVEALYGSGAATYGDLYNFNLGTLTQTYDTVASNLLSRPCVSGGDAGDFRTANDGYLRVLSNGDIRGGHGYLGNGAHIAWAGVGKYVGATEDASGRVYMVTQEGPTMVGLRMFNGLSSVPNLVDSTILPYFQHGALNGVAIYAP